MTTGGGEGDPFELDPFGESEYDPSLAFAHVAATKAKQLFADAERFVRHELFAHLGHTNQIAASARKSSEVQLFDLLDMADEVDEARQRVDQHAATSVEFRLAVNDTVDRFHRLQGAYDQLMHTAAQMAAEDPVLASTAPAAIDPSALLEPRPASLQVAADLRAWLQAHKDDQGALVVIKATPGVGKTHAMLQQAYADHMNRLRVTVAVRTKEMIAGQDAEVPNRLKQLSFGGRVHLAVIHGRDETNCYKHETVQAVMAHGYAPGPTVCMQCEHYPSNARMYGLSVCGYYQERITADLMSKGARRGFHRNFPLICTTHASRIAAGLVQGGRWGGFWAEDRLYADEDPTDAMEIDTVLTEGQCGFVSSSADTVAAGVVAHLYRAAIDLAKLERADVAKTSFCAPGTKARHTHPIHSRYDSAYTGQALIALLERALVRVQATTRTGSLDHTLREAETQGGFRAAPGVLAQVTSADDINALDIPPKSLALVAKAAGAEMHHTLALQRLVYEQTMARPLPIDPNEALRELEEHTEIEPTSYMLRLECLPADTNKGRLRDEWRFVVRDFRPLVNHEALIIVGDAYAQKEHYEHLFSRPADMIDVVASLHPEARFLRILDSQCNIGTLREGGLQRVLSVIENQLVEDTKPGDRVLFYAHEELRPHIEKWIEEPAKRLGLTWAYEHWWGGRGKDQYNGWEFVVCMSDPVLSLSGIKHVANARAFRASVLAKTPEDKLLHARRCEVESDKRGAVYALRNSHPRIALEHDRMNVAELTQALHRGRPAHHPVTAITIGEMEQSPDLIAQTETIVGPESRKVKVATSRTKQEVLTVDTFVTPDEALAAMLAIIEHYGVYSRWFAHALVTALRQDDTACHSGDSDKAVHSLVTPDCQDDIARHSGNPGELNDSEGLSSFDTGVSVVVLKGLPLKTTTETLAKVDTPLDGGGGGKVPEPLKARRPSARRGATEPAEAPGSVLEALPNPRTVIERVWHPSAYWRLLAGWSAQPRAIREAHERLGRIARLPSGQIRTVPTRRWPRWAEGLVDGGRHPVLFYDSRLLRVDAALREYYRIVENQYGPAMGGRLVRPNAEMQVPGSMSAVPF